MTQNTNIMKKESKLRLTAFVDPDFVKRAKVRGALEGLTISEIVEKALDAYTPKLEKASDQHIHVKFVNYPTSNTPIFEKGLKSTEIVPKHTKVLAVPR